MSEPATPLIEGYALGPFATNCYIVRVPGAPECWIVDASFQPDPLIERVRELDAEPTHLLLTHAHVDHIAGLEQIRAAFPGLRVLLHPDEAAWLGDPVSNLSAGFGELVVCAPPDGPLKDNQTLELAGTRWNVLHTPGHSPGSVTLHHPPSDQAIVGDTLFSGSIGRFDFPTSDEQQLLTSIRERLYTLPDDTTVHPGHGPATTIGREKKTNPFVRADGANA